MKYYPTRLTIFGLMFCFAASTYAAPFSVSGSATAQAGGNRAGIQPIQQTLFSGSSASGASASNVYNSSYGIGNSTASSRVQAGALSVVAASDADAWVGGLNQFNSQGDAISTTAAANARLYDSFIVQSGSASNGSKGTITIAYSIDGSVGGIGGGQWNGSAQWLAHVSLQGTFNGGGYTNAYWSGGERFSASSTAAPNYIDYDTVNGSLGQHTMTFGVFFGSPVLLDIGVQSNAQAGAGSYCEYISSNFVCHTANAAFIVDVGNTIKWGGIVDVRDETGMPIADFTAFSATSGFNYAAPVPAPAALWLFASGLPMVFWRRKLRA